MINSKKLSIAFIGLGRVYNHYKNILKDFKIYEVNVVGVCDKNKNKVNEEAKYWDCDGYQSYKDMIEAIDADLLLILTPSGLHYEHAKYCLENDLNVLVEKPLTMTPLKSIELMDLSKSRKKMLSVAFQNRFNPAIKFLKKIVREGSLGKIITVSIRLRWCRYQEYYEDDWHGTWLMDGGVINQQAIHHLDAMTWIFGPIDSVCASSENRLNKLEAEDTLVAIAKFKNGSLGTIEATTAARDEDFEASLEVISEGGIIQIGGIALNKIKFIKLKNLDKKVSEEIIQNFSQNVKTGYGLSHSEILENTFEALINGDINAPVEVSTTLPTTYLVHSIYKSVESNKWISLDSMPTSEKLGSEN